MTETVQMIGDLASFGRVGVFMGGWSAEREISLKSGQQVLQGLLSAGVDAVGVDVNCEQLRALKGDEYDRVFLVLHGPGGEDGMVQAYLEMIGVPYTGSGVLGSALSMSKLSTKCLWHGVGLPTPEWRIVNSVEECYCACEELGLPMMVKPIAEGSSIGMSRVDELEQVESSFSRAAQYGVVFVEKFISGRELTVGVLGERALPVIEIFTPHEFYDYRAKYFSENTQYHCPADIPDWLASECQSLALQAFAAVSARDWGRVDFMCDGQNNPWLIEINTAPGMTNHSLVPMAASRGRTQL